MVITCDRLPMGWTMLFVLAASTALPIDRAPAVLADGAPWRMVATDGRTARLTLWPDGRGRLEGPVSITIRWRVEGGRFCLRMGLLLGKRCVERFDAVDGGWHGAAAGGAGFTLTRP